MQSRYVYRGSEKLRCGYTTGSCACAGAKACAEGLLSGSVPEQCVITLPNGETVTLEIKNIVRGENFVSCSVEKDGGDDPDVTSGLDIYSKVRLIPDSEKIFITGGEGVGVVTRKGLDQPVGEYAINSVPRKMIKSELLKTAEKYNYKGGFGVEIYVKGGEETAKKTYNPRMGIVGGISILGTTGIVEPMSNSAILDTMRAEASMLKSEGVENLVISMGNYSDSFIAENMNIPLEKTLKCSNFVGDALDMAVEYKFKSATVVGHIGKMAKLGAGIMNTHSSVADGRMEVIITCGLLAGADRETLLKIPECVTVDSALDILESAGVLQETVQVLSERINYHISQRVKGTIETGAVFFSYKHDIVKYII